MHIKLSNPFSSSNPRLWTIKSTTIFLFFRVLGSDSIASFPLLYSMSTVYSPKWNLLNSFSRYRENRAQMHRSLKSLEIRYCSDLLNFSIAFTTSRSHLICLSFGFSILLSFSGRYPNRTLNTINYTFATSKSTFKSLVKDSCWKNIDRYHGK